MTNYKHHIRTHDKIPVKIPARRLPLAYREKIDRQIQDMFKQNIIKRSKSPYSAPCVFTQKKNEEIRMCINYRQLNKKTVKDAYPLPLPDVIQEQGDSFFSTLDLCSGKFQSQKRIITKQHFVRDMNSDYLSLQEYLFVLPELLQLFSE